MRKTTPSGDWHRLQVDHEQVDLALQLFNVCLVVFHLRLSLGNHELGKLSLFVNALGEMHPTIQFASDCRRLFVGILKLNDIKLFRFL